MNELEAEPRAGARKRGLGMGLSALLGGASDLAGAEGVRTVPIEFLRPSALQPRRYFGEDELAGLAESIRAKGVMQPLLVRRLPDADEQYEIVAGERRWRAAQLAGCHELPVVLYALSDREALELALLENVQRQDLTPLEEADGYRRLIDEFGHTQEELARTLGKSRSHVANLIRLLGLPSPLRTMLESGQLSAGHARALLGARDPAPLARQVVARGLNVRQTEALVRNERHAIKLSGPKPPDADTMAVERDLSTRLGLPVRLQPRGSGGTLRIAYRSLEQLEELIRRLT
jgi:ParB family transcriptional regulator, chromosome partitioning protein